METIRIAHSRGRHGFRVFSCEVVPAIRDARGYRSGFHVASGETLESARADIDRTIAREFAAAGRPVPPVVECGRVPDAIGRAWAF